MMSSARPIPQSKPSPQRRPIPSLFHGPPSRNASNLSLGSGLFPSAPAPETLKHPPLLRTRSSRPPSPFLPRSQSQGDIDNAEALWQEMQSTLAEVELSAISGEHVFGEEHSKALEDLRAKQLRLAQAWARSEVDEIVENKDGDEIITSTAKPGRPGSGGKSERGARDTTGTSRTLEEETEKDLQLARERREANDRYFNRVNSGVLDVVAKLEEVAQAMQAVERESKGIWSDSTTDHPATSTGSTHG